MESSQCWNEMEVTLQQRGSMALKLGPNLRAIVSLRNSELDHKLSSLFITDIMPNWLTKRNENWTVLQNYNSNTRVSTTYLRLKPSYLYKNDDPTSVLHFRSSTVQLEFNCWSCRMVIIVVPVEQFITVVPVEQLAVFLSSEGRWIRARSSWWESRGMSLEPWTSSPKTRSATSLSPYLLFRCLLLPFNAKTWNHNALVT